MFGNNKHLNECRTFKNKNDSKNKDQHIQI